MKIFQFILYPLIFIWGFWGGYIARNQEIENLKHQIDTFPESYDYQIETNLKGYTIYEGSRPVSFVKWNQSQTFDSIIIKDNL